MHLSPLGIMFFRRVTVRGTSMAASEKLMWKIYAGAIGAVTTIVAQKLVTKL